MAPVTIRRLISIGLALSALAPLQASGERAPIRDISLQTRCAHPELFLTSEPLANMKAVLLEQCGEQAHSAKVRRFETDSCEVKDFLRNAIFAAHGKKFRKKKWQTVFGLAVWYQPSDSYSDRMLSRQAWKNVKALRAGCVESARFRKDKKLLQRWLQALHKQQHKKAGRLMAFPFHSFGESGKGCETLSGVSEKITNCLTGFREAKELIAGWRTSPWVIYSDRARYLFGQEDLAARGVTLAGTRVMSVNFVPGDLACQMGVNPERSAKFVEDCGGYGMSVTVFISKRNKIVAAHWDGGAACPYVYLKGPDGLAFQGEILRNLIGVERETSQTLPIALAMEPRGIIELVVREEKDETTYADDALLELDGHRIRPQRCDNDAAHELCKRDKRYWQLRKGEEITLRFAVPHGHGDIDIRDARLRMSGFYIPTRRAVVAEH